MARLARRGEVPVNPQEERLGRIYKSTCRETGKSYIGQSKLVKYKDGKPFRYGAKGRWHDHVSSALNGERTYPIFEAIREFGADGFELDILDVCYMEDLDSKETEHIKAHNTLVPDGYNVVEYSPNCHTPVRLQLLSEESKLDLVVAPDFFEKEKERLRSKLSNKHQDKVDSFKDQEIIKVRLATAKNVSAKRQSGNNIPYTTVTVYVMTSDMKYAKEAKKFRFGGVSIPIDRAHDEALEFAYQLPLVEGGEFIDQVE